MLLRDNIEIDAAAISTNIKRLINTNVWKS